jgi:DnaJ-domain-containing protein 1
MFELAGALIIGLLTWQGISLLLARGIVLGRGHKRREERKREAKWRSFFEDHQRGNRRGQEERWRQTKESEAERQRVRAAEQSEESEWWTVLEVSPDARPDEIRQSYLRKIKQSHPDLVAWLGPEYARWGERHTKTLNAAYAKAIRARRRT